MPLQRLCRNKMQHDGALNPVPAGYDGGLLRAAADLGDRLMPAFDTPTRIPLSWVNLRRVRRQMR